MYKSRLQELCQRRSWELPVYSTGKDGPDHMPSFTASVTVNGQAFDTPAKCKSSKDAQNTCARIAFDYFDIPSQPESTSAPAAAITLPQGIPPAAPPPSSPPIAARSTEMKPAFAPLLPLSPLPPSLPTPPPGLLMAKKANANPANDKIVQQQSKDTEQTSASMINTVAIVSPDTHTKDTLHMFKNQLQQFAQKKNFDLPVYTTKSEGPPHSRRFKSGVSVNGKLYERPDFFTSLKEAEQAAAKVACQAFSVDAIQEDGGLHKNLLQELAQKKGMVCPSYESIKSGLPHRPLFVSTVEIGSRKIRGAEAKTKKQAEMNAAKAAYYTLMESCPSTEDSSASSDNQCDVDIIISQNVEPSANITKHQDATAEDVQLHAKRSKSSEENTNFSSHLPDLSEDNSVSNDSRNLQPQPVKEQQVKEKTSICSKTVVCPKKSSLPKPEGAYVLLYSNDEWIAYFVEHVHEQNVEIM